MPDLRPKEFLRALFDVAVESAMPKPEWFLDLAPPRGRTIVIGAGKAASSMANAFERSWDSHLEGIVVVPYGAVALTQRIRVVQASHPILMQQV